ncbi:TonB-dependent receptor [Martelella mangrovi]|uniref:TonB-dependent receptor n=1 Tax=Martelella mangrovi TaxID=1397477 RepID=A0ABV2I720_9HYPH
MSLALADDPVQFAISVDGEPVVIDNKPVAQVKPEKVRQVENRAQHRARRTDVDLNDVDIQVKFDGLDTRPVLNVATDDIEESFKTGDRIRFFTASNYPAYIDRAEIRVFGEDDNLTPESVPLAVVPAKLNGETEWDVPPVHDGDDALIYVLRVYGKNGLYDETRSRVIWLETPERLQDMVDDDGDLATDIAVDEALSATTIGVDNVQGALDMSEDYALRRNIPVVGGTVTVYGRNVPGDYQVRTLGDDVEVDDDGSFVIQRIIPNGEHSVDVSVDKPNGETAVEFSRDIDIPDSEWFYMGLADLTIGQRTGSHNIEEVRDEEYDEVYTNGRVAFYLKGKIKGEYILTAALDTEEDDLADLFPGLDERNARQLLKELNADDYYPVYGDDSAAIDDAPTSGKFYVRLQHHDSHIMWGDYRVRIDGTELQNTNRALYGAQAVYQPDKATSFGAPQTQLQAYGAAPDTLSAVDQFLGTGGSVYFLNHSDLTADTETLTIEVRNPDTGVVVSSSTLAYGEDYTIDYIQGVIILTDPLASKTGTTSAVRFGAIGGNDVYLVAEYDYTPVIEDVDGTVYGGRAEQWFGDHLRIGVTGSSDGTGEDTKDAYGADVRLRYSDSTFLDAEIAKTHGAASGQSISMDGGLTHTDLNTNDIGKSALGWRLAGQVDLADINENAEGLIQAYFEDKQAGFNSLTEDLNAPQMQWGISANAELSDTLSLALSYDYFDSESYYNEDSHSYVVGSSKQQGDLSLTRQIDERWALSGGLGYTLQRRPSETTVATYGDDGERLDLGIRAEYTLDDEESTVYVFGQTTVFDKGNIERGDRGGIGTSYQITERLGLDGEVSYGTTGWGGMAGVSYKPNDTDRYYVNYVLDPDRAYDWNQTYDLYGQDLRTVVVGAEQRMNDMWSVYAENNYDLYGERNTMSRTYCVKFEPDAIWTVDAAYEGGMVDDDTIDPITGLKNTDFDRDSFSLAFNYDDDEENGIVARLRGEARFEDSEDGTDDIDSYLI